ncbi:uncharacterized protein BKA78DRAFT_178886 [Phyllosticta capitalensis]|uniref:uncharacterized protein n=1 Tax=Phyllosticta capitalensis TaxID=121624 RepID=UPI00312EB580
MAWPEGVGFTRAEAGLEACTSSWNWRGKKGEKHCRDGGRRLIILFVDGQGCRAAQVWLWLHSRRPVRVRCNWAPQSAADEPQLQRQSHSVCDKSRAGLGRLELEELRNCVCPATSIQDEKCPTSSSCADGNFSSTPRKSNIPFSLVAMHAGAKMRWRCFFRPSLQQQLSTIAHSQPPRFSARY